MPRDQACSPQTAKRRGRRCSVVAILAAVAIFAVLLCPPASANSVKQRLHAVAREFNAPAAQAAERVGAISQCPLTLDQVAAALPLSSGIQGRSSGRGCVFWTGTTKDLAVGRQPVLLYIDESKGRIDPQPPPRGSSRLCSLGTSRNAIGPTTFSLCGITPRQRKRNGLTGSPEQRVLVFEFEAPDHKFIWIVNVTYEVHQAGFRAQDPETGLLAVLKSFS